MHRSWFLTLSTLLIACSSEPVARHSPPDQPAPTMPSPMAAASNAPAVTRDAEAAAWMKDHEAGQASISKLTPAKAPPAIFGELDGMPSMNGWKIGSVQEVAIVVIPSMAAERNCAAPKKVKGLACGYKSNDDFTEGAPGLTEAELLQPFWTTDDKRFVGAGLWSMAPTRDLLEKGHGDAVALSCKVKVVSLAMIQFKLRTGHPFMNSAGPWDVVRFESCSVVSFQDVPTTG